MTCLSVAAVSSSASPLQSRMLSRSYTVITSNLLFLDLRVSVVASVGAVDGSLRSAQFLEGRGADSGEAREALARFLLDVVGSEFATWGMVRKARAYQGS